MNKIFQTSIAMMAFSISACATTKNLSANKARVIEFKSDASGFDTKTFFYEGEKEVVAIDSQFTPELAQASIDHLRKFTKKPITWLVITHPNPDKFNGASVFKSQGARIISSVATSKAIPEVHAYKEYFFVEMAKMFKKGSYPHLVPMDQTFEGEMDLVLKGGERLFLRELSQPGVSATQTVVYVKNLKALFVGDLIHNEAHSWLEGGIVQGAPSPTIEAWIKGLNELAVLYPPETQVFAGRGISLNLETSVKSQIRYLQTAQQIVTQAVQKFGTKPKDFNADSVGILSKSLAAEFSRQFPTYQLSYMIEYGVYGLVQSEIKKIK